MNTEQVRDRRASWPYVWTYADPVSVGPRPPFVLELWVPGKRKGSGSWVAQSAAPVGNYRAWRRVREFHNHADKLAHSIATVKPCGYARDARAQVDYYLDFARRAGLRTVHIFKGDRRARTAARAFGLAVIEVDPAEFTGPTPAVEEA